MSACVKLTVSTLSAEEQFESIDTVRNVKVLKTLYTTWKQFITFRKHNVVWICN